jgi:dCMP deaminase
MRNFDSKYMKMAQIWASNSHAKRNKVGALIVKDGMIISDGFNGTPSGFENECEYIVPCGNTCTNLFGQDCEHCKEHKLKTKPYVLHAEANAILKVSRSTNSAEGATLYCTLSPCLECAKLIIQAGITRLVYAEQYRDTEGLELLKRSNIQIKQLKV